MIIRLERFFYRFAEQVLNSKLNLKQEHEEILTDPNIDLSKLSRPYFNSILDKDFFDRGWECQPCVFDAQSDPLAKMDFLKDRVGVEVAFKHASFIGIDLLKFQVCSYSGLDKIDIGIYVVNTKNFQKRFRFM
jgi:hypothetical protein